jgi:hypothetical protein
MLVGVPTNGLAGGHGEGAAALALRYANFFFASHSFTFALWQDCILPYS